MSIGHEADNIFGVFFICAFYGVLLSIINRAEQSI